MSTAETTHSAAMNAERLPAVGYAAKSTKDTKDSIPDQLADCRALAEAKGYVQPIFEFKDEAKSAYHGDRGDGLADAMAKCEQLSALHGRSVLIVQHSDRLARGDAKEARHLIEIVLWAIKHNVELVSKQDPEILAGGDLALLLGAIGGMRNHQDSKRKSESVTDGLRRRTAKGKALGGTRPYGYQRLGGELVIDPAEAPLVRRIFAMADSGMSQRRIAATLDEQGVTIRSGAKWIGQATVGRILAQPLYAGRVRHGVWEDREGIDGKPRSKRVSEDTFPGTHEPIVDPELWARVNASRSSKPRRAGGREQGGKFLLTRGLLRCGRCGAAMVPRLNGNGSESYRCLTRQRDCEACNQSAVPRALIDEAILTELSSRYLDLDESRRRYRDRLSADLGTARIRVERTEMELEKVKRRLSVVVAAFQAEKIDADDYAEQRSDLLAEQKGAQGDVEQSRRHFKKLESAGVGSDAEEALLRYLSDLRAMVIGSVSEAPDLPALRTIIRQLFASVELCSSNRFYGSGVVRDGMTAEHTPTAGEYHLLITVRWEAFDLDQFESLRAALSVPEKTDSHCFESQ
jgi:site-specific DNA recombinase